MEKCYNNNRSQWSTRTLEITILSCEDLRINKRPIGKNAYVTVRSGTGESRTTSIDTDGGSYPTWNQKLAGVELPPAHAPPPFSVEVRCKTAFGDKVVGTASVPASDFSGGYLPESYLHFLSYRLRDSRGERNGIVNISVRTNSPTEHQKKYTCSAEQASSSATVGVPVGNNNSHGVVTGVPVMCSYQRSY